MKTRHYSPESISTIKHWLGSGSINFFGKPFAGKDSQAERIQSLVGGTVLGGGKILRESEIPEDIQDLMNNGTLIPTDDYVKIVLPYLSSEELANQPLLLSAVGRMHGEEEAVIEALRKSDHELKAVIHLSLTDELVLERLGHDETRINRGERPDDNPEVVNRRIVEFNTKTLPVVDYYSQRGLLIEVDASQTRDAVTQEIIDQLASRALQS